MLPPLGVKSVTNPLPAEGGADPESSDDAPEHAAHDPHSGARSVGPRLRGLRARLQRHREAQARVLSLPAGRTVVITIAGPDGAAITPASPTWINLLDALRSMATLCRRSAALYQASTFRVGLRVKRDPAYDIDTVLAAVEATLRERSLSSSVYSRKPSSSRDLHRARRAWRCGCRHHALYGGTRPPAQTNPGPPQVRLRIQMRVENGIAKPAELLTLTRPFDQLEGSVSTLSPAALRLLPAVYRLRDEAQGEPMRALLQAFAFEFAALVENVEQLYDDQFIETCAEWVTPYIGDLIGYRPLHGQASQIASPRAEVANTIAFRRRKGTALMLEELARDVTGWPAHAVEFFEQLVTTQYMNHTRPHARATADLRNVRAAARPGRCCVQQHRAHGGNASAGERRQVQHPEHWNLPLAAGGTPPLQHSADSRSRRCDRPQVPRESAGRGHPALPASTTRG
jgi:hypothetical protein